MLVPDARAGFIEKACAGDKTLRAEVESLIDSYEQAQGFIDAPVTDDAMRLISNARSRAAAAEPLIIGSGENLKATQGEKNPDTIAAARRAAELYEKWNKPQLANQYRALLAASAPTH